MAVHVMSFVWLGVAILAAIAEALIPALVSVWFVPAGIVALIVSVCGGPIWLQVLLFTAVSLGTLALTRPLAKKLVGRQRVRTNADRVVGATGIIIQDVDNVLSTGRVTVLGASWAAYSSQPDGKIPAGTKVRIEQIVGVTLVVTPLAPEEEKER